MRVSKISASQGDYYFSVVPTQIDYRIGGVVYALLVAFELDLLLVNRYHGVLAEVLQQAEYYVIVWCGARGVKINDPSYQYPSIRPTTLS